jgi:hypothetical protein
MGRHKSKVHEHYTAVAHESIKEAVQCNYCSEVIRKNSTRMGEHLLASLFLHNRFKSPYFAAWLS